MGLGSAHAAFVQTNAMLALSDVFKFSVKDNTHSQSVFRFIYFDCLTGSLLEGAPTKWVEESFRSAVLFKPS